jgi:hypothetical protein
MRLVLLHTLNSSPTILIGKTTTKKSHGCFADFLLVVARNLGLHLLTELTIDTMDMERTFIFMFWDTCEEAI